MLTVLLILAIAAFVVAVLSAISKAPLWVSVVILCVIELLRQLPLGR